MAIAERAPQTEAPRNPEGISFMEEQVAFQARLLAVTASPAADRELLNPDRTDVPEITAESMATTQRDYTIIKNASVTERAHYWDQRTDVAIDARHQTWTTETKTAFDNSQRFFGTRKGQQWAAVFQRMNINAVGFGNTDAESLYNTYFSSQNERDNIDRFVNTVIAVHTNQQTKQFDRATFEQNRDAIQWLANLFGEKSAQVMTQIADGETKPREEVANAANQDNRRNTVTDKEYELFDFLYRPQEALRKVTPTRPPQAQRQPRPAPVAPIEPVRPIIATIPRTDTHTQMTTVTPHVPSHTPRQNLDTQTTPSEGQAIERQQPLENRPYKLQEVFENIHGNVVSDPTRNRFFVTNVPETFSLPSTQDKSLSLAVPFIQLRQDGQALTNRQVAPWAWEIGPNTPGALPRFVNGERATNGDSGIIGVSAAGAENPEQQARFYKHIADTVVTMHQRNDHLLPTWLRAQGRFDQPSSGRLMMMYDHQAPPEITSLDDIGDLRPENERLFYWSMRLAPHEGGFEPMWKHRLGELEEALKNDQLQPYHLRWIEFLSHSVDVDTLIQMMKQPHIATNTADTTSAAPASEPLGETAVQTPPSPDILVIDEYPPVLHTEPLSTIAEAKILDPNRDIKEQIQEALAQTSPDITSMPFVSKPQDIITSLQGISLGGGTLESAQAYINNNGFLELTAQIKGQDGKATYTATIGNNPSGKGLQVTKHSLDFSSGAGFVGFFNKGIKDKMNQYKRQAATASADLNSTLFKAINTQIDQWEVENMRIAEKNLEMILKRKPTSP